MPNPKQTMHGSWTTAVIPTVKLRNGTFSVSLASDCLPSKCAITQRLFILNDYIFLFLVRQTYNTCSNSCNIHYTYDRRAMLNITITRRDIKSGEELTFDYQFDTRGQEKKACLCGSSNCSGFLGVPAKKMVEISTKEPKKKTKKRRRKVCIVVSKY